MNATPTCCEYCLHFEFDDEYEEHICTISIDQDELSRYYTHSKYRCPYFKIYNEYSTVNKQI